MSDTNCLAQLPPNARILDAGGWAFPSPLATHVIDLLPWETRRRKLQLERLADEQFSKETWTQADFCSPEFKIPYEDKFFDFAICSHTLEDLHSPIFLIRELNRTARAGYIEVPSRFYEQTIGIAGPSARYPGQNHHKWIVDEDDGVLVFFDKAESLHGPPSQYLIPFLVFKRVVRRTGYAPSIGYHWQQTIRFRISKSGDEARKRARARRASVAIRFSDTFLDAAYRFGRRTRDRALNRNAGEPDLSHYHQRYSQIDLS